MKEKHIPLSKPTDELLYWNIFRGEKVSLRQLRRQAPLSAFAAEDLITRGEATSEPVYDRRGRKRDVVIFIQKPATQSS